MSAEDAMTPEAFVVELDAQNRAALEQLGAKSAAGEAPGALTVKQLLKLALRNELAAFCEEKGDRETAALYRDKIQPDEQHHHELGRKLLLKYATTDELQAKARAAAKRTLEIADEIQEMARMKLGVCRAPGC